MSEFGVEGYGVYWIILEKIAGNMEGGDRTSLEISLKSWSKSCGISPKKFRKFAEFLANLGCFVVEISGQNLKIDCPKLLKYKDEYARKSGQKKRRVRTNSQQDTEIEIDTEIETEEEKIPARKKRAPSPKISSSPSATKVPSQNIWGWWVVAHRLIGRPDPISTGPDLGAVKGIRDMGLPDEKVKTIMRRYLRDSDNFIKAQGHPLRLLPGRVNRYQDGAEARADGLSDKARANLEAFGFGGNDE